MKLRKSMLAISLCGMLFLSGCADEKPQSIGSAEDAKRAAEEAKKLLLENGKVPQNSGQNGQNSGQGQQPGAGATITPRPAGRGDSEPSTVNENSGKEYDKLDGYAFVSNKLRKIPRENYEPADLVSLNIRSINGQPLRQVAARALEKMSADARAATGAGFALCSGFRSQSSQVSVYGSLRSSMGQAEADRVSARPGHSEHQLGLAADIVGEDQGCQLDDSYANTRSGKWVSENAHKYGFVLRYPAG
ncbi:MAG: D-alanyl-D-alanine carboxypeptidase family protein, partial [Microbacteriaceae bacterium]|nr:D-alanyl-D-alanine carboxypeptidase family protein [Microbacteriaceae bacterium]